MSLKYINNIEYANEIEELYLNSFPKEERFPFWILEECSKENNSDLYGIIDNDKLIGLCYLVYYSYAYYLMYLAVDHNLLMDLKEKYKVLFLSIDSPVDNISVRRKNFYLRNGFYDTNKFYEDTGINYEVLCTNNEYEITDDIMKMRYNNMTNNCKLFEVISNTFNIGLVNLKIKHKK